MPNIPARYDARHAVSSLLELGAQRLYVEELRDGSWILRYGGTPSDVARFLDYATVARPLRVRPAEERL